MYSTPLLHSGCLEVPRIKTLKNDGIVNKMSLYECNFDHITLD